jgi:hypothetical protein
MTLRFDLGELVLCIGERQKTHEIFLSELYA